MLYFREVLAMRGTPQTIVSNFVNTSRQHMLQKTSHEFENIEGSLSESVAALLAVGKGDGGFYIKKQHSE